MHLLYSSISPDITSRPNPNPNTLAQAPTLIACPASFPFSTPSKTAQSASTGALLIQKLIIIRPSLQRPQQNISTTSPYSSPKPSSPPRPYSVSPQTPWNTRGKLRPPLSFGRS